MPKAVIFGHSYVRRLGEALAEHPEWHNGRPDLIWECVGVGGASLNPTAPENKLIFHHVHRLADMRPDVVFIHIGENDILTMNQDEIWRKIVQLVECVSAVARPRAVVIGQLTKFPAQGEAGAKSKHINKRLKMYCHGEKYLSHNGGADVSVWKHRIGLFGPNRLRRYARDGVHLNSEAMREYAHSVGTAVNKAYNKHCV